MNSHPRPPLNLHRTMCPAVRGVPRCAQGQNTVENALVLVIPAPIILTCVVYRQCICPPWSSGTARYAPDRNDWRIRCVIPCCQTRRQSHEIVYAADREARDVGLTKGSDAQRYVLQGLGAPLSGDDDFLELNGLLFRSLLVLLTTGVAPEDVP